MHRIKKQKTKQNKTQAGFKKKSQILNSYSNCWKLKIERPLESIQEKSNIAYRKTKIRITVDSYQTSYKPENNAVDFSKAPKEKTSARIFYIVKLSFKNDREI